MADKSIHYSVIRDHFNAMILAGKFITIHTRNRPDDMYEGINGQSFPGMKIPRIELYYPLRHGDTRHDVISHECAHICYADMTMDKINPEIEAIKIIANIEPELIDFYSGASYLGEECVVRLADLRRQGVRLPSMSRRLSAIVRTLSRPKPFQVGMWALALVAALSAVVAPAFVFAADTAYPMPTGSESNMPHMSGHVYGHNGDCVRVVPRSASAPSTVIARDMGDLIAQIRNRSDWLTQDVSCDDYQSKLDVWSDDWTRLIRRGSWSAMQFDGTIYYPVSR